MRAGTGAAEWESVYGEEYNLDQLPAMKFFNRHLIPVSDVEQSIVADIALNMHLVSVIRAGHS